MRQLRLFPNLAILTVFLSGCATTTLSSAHKPAAAIVSAPVVDSIVVERATEARPLGGRSRIGVAFITFLPFVPYARQEFTPERYLKNNARLNHDFLRDISDVVAKDLQASGIARFVASTDPAIQAAGSLAGAYTLRLALDEGIWHRNFTTHGLSIAAPSGKSIAKRSFRAEAPIREWIYTRHVFLRKLAVAFAELAPEIREFVRTWLRQESTDHP